MKILLRMYFIWDFDASIDAVSEELSKQNDTYKLYVDKMK